MSRFHFPRTEARATITLVLVRHDKGILVGKKNSQGQEERNNPLLWPPLMMVEACHFLFFPTRQNLRCEQLGESEAGPEKKRENIGAEVYSSSAVVSLSHKSAAVDKV